MNDLRDYQQPIVDRAVSTLTPPGSRAQVLMACGTGKTRVGLRTVEQVMADNTIDTPVVAVMLPNLSLLAQTARVWDRHTVWGDAVFLPVCSQVETDMHGDQGETESVQERFTDLLGDLVDCERFYTRTTDPTAVTAWLNAHRDKPRVLFCTYQSSQALADTTHQHGRLDMVLCDEAHRTTGEDTDTEFGKVLNDKIIGADRRLFMTATQKTFTSAAGTGAGTRTGGVRSMDNVNLYGPVVGDYTFSQAIADGNLVAYDVQIFAADTTEARRQGMHRLDIEKAITRNVGARDARLETVADQVHSLVADGRCRSVMVFHWSIADSKKFAKYLAALARDAGTNMESYHVDGTTHPDVRKQVLDKMRHAHDPGSPAVVCSNVKVFTEGIDVPAMDAVVLAAPRSSAVDVAQIVGRALRLPDGSAAGTGRSHRRALVVLAVVSDEDHDGDMAVARGTMFHDTVATLRALGQFDRTLVDVLDKAASAATRKAYRLPRRRTLTDNHPPVDVTGDPAGALREDVESSMNDPGLWSQSPDGLMAFDVPGAGVTVLTGMTVDEVRKGMGWGDDQPLGAAPTEDEAPSSPPSPAVSVPVKTPAPVSHAPRVTLVLPRDGSTAPARHRPVTPVTPGSGDSRALLDILDGLEGVAQFSTMTLSSVRPEKTDMLKAWADFFATTSRLTRRQDSPAARRDPWPDPYPTVGDAIWQARERSMFRWLSARAVDAYTKGAVYPELDDVSPGWQEGIAGKIQAGLREVADANMVPRRPDPTTRPLDADTYDHVESLARRTRQFNEAVAARG